MKRKSLILFLVACLDVVLLAVALKHGFADKACFVPRTANAAIHGWYVKVRTDGGQPEEPPEFAFIKNYGGYWLGDPEDKVIYLTFDAGYENGYTPQILDALKKHEVPVAFFLVSHYITSAPELTQRMVDEGHLVCNHSMHHKDMATMADFDAFAAELAGTEAAFHALTGKQMPKYFRPPEGRLSKTCLEYAHRLGYKTVFWSFAYRDWHNDNQPSEQAAIDTMLSRTHPGMVALLHATSATNARVLDAVIAEWKAMGYRFESLDDLAARP